MTEEIFEKLSKLWAWKQTIKHKWTGQDIWNLLGEDYDVDSDSDDVIDKIKTVKLDELEYFAIVRALEKSNYHQRNASKLLGISARQLNYKINLYGIRHETWNVNK